MIISVLFVSLLSCKDSFGPTPIDLSKLQGATWVSVNSQGLNTPTYRFEGDSVYFGSVVKIDDRFDSLTLPWTLGPSTRKWSYNEETRRLSFLVPEDLPDTISIVPVNIHDWYLVNTFDESIEVRLFFNRIEFNPSIGQFEQKETLLDSITIFVPMEQ